jgi:hypothetical protein
MRKIAAVLAFAIAASVLSLAIVGTSGAIQQETTLSFTWEQVSQTTYDIDDNAELTPGDGWVSNSNLKKGGEVVGKTVESCQYVTVRKDGMGGTLQCIGTVKLDGGQITYQLRLVLEEGTVPRMVAAVTGGTGDYANTRGTASSAVDLDTMKVTVTLHLLP